VNSWWLLVTSNVLPQVVDKKQILVLKLSGQRLNKVFVYKHWQHSISTPTGCVYLPDLPGPQSWRCTTSVEVRIRLSTNVAWRWTVGTHSWWYSLGDNLHNQWSHTARNNYCRTILISIAPCLSTKHHANDSTVKRSYNLRIPLAKIFAYLFTAMNCDVTVTSHRCFVHFYRLLMVLSLCVV